MEELSKKFPGATLVNFYEEEGNDFCGVTVAKDGISEGTMRKCTSTRSPSFASSSQILDR